MSRSTFFTMSGSWFFRARSLIKRERLRFFSEIKPARKTCSQAKCQGIVGRQGGYALIGVMVGVIIFSGGVIGIAGMHSQATRSNHDSFQRSQAIWLSYDLAERIKSNLDGMDEYQTTLATANVDLQNFCRLPPASWTTCTSSGNPCDSTAVARFDLFESMCGDSLISPDMAINCSGTCDSGDEVTITLSWDSRGAAAGALTERQQIELTFRRD